MTRPKRHSTSVGEIPVEDRIQAAVRIYMARLNSQREISIRKAALSHGVPWETVRDRIAGRCPRKKALEEFQKLSVFEETVIEKYCLQLYAWGWPARIYQIRKMAVELLKEKGDNKPLGPNWQSRFLRRHPELKSKISSPRARDRFLAQDHGIFNHWFDLFLEQKEKYCVHDDDVYNMDEKGVMLGVAGKVAVIIPKTEKNPHTSNGSGNRDWATSTECISLTGRLLPSWTIFKGKLNLNKWHNTMERIGLAESGYNICTSENGWTDNELGVEYLEKHFDRHTKGIKKGEYRILVLDGHDSHITTKAIQFCLENKIILLCLPPHATHMLQPLDVGIFGPLAQAYKGMITEKYSFGATYNIDKCDFLEIWHAAREKAITAKNIESAWSKCGILQQKLSKGTLDREAVLSQLPPPPLPPIQPSSRPTTSGGPVEPNQLNSTPNSVAEVQAVIQRIKRGQLSDTDTLTALEKLGKAATNALAETTATRSINQSLVEATKQREKRKQQIREDGADGSYARVMGREEVQRRKEYHLDKKWLEAIKPFQHAAFEVVFSVNITKKDKGISSEAPTKSLLPRRPRIDQQPQAEKPLQKAPSRCSLCRSLQHNARKCPSRNIIVP
jgi:hypothetical protein